MGDDVEFSQSRYLTCRNIDSREDDASGVVDVQVGNSPAGLHDGLSQLRDPVTGKVVAVRVPELDV